jgi:hypothetical protein
MTDNTPADRDRGQKAASNEPTDGDYIVDGNPGVASLGDEFVDAGVTGRTGEPDDAGSDEMPGGQDGVEFDDDDR